MALDPAPLAIKTAELMDELEDEYGSEAELIAGVIVVEVRHPHLDEEGLRLNSVHVMPTDDSDISRNVGLCARASHTLLQPDDDDD